MNIQTIENETILLVSLLNHALIKPLARYFQDKGLTVVVKNNIPDQNSIYSHIIFLDPNKNLLNQKLQNSMIIFLDEKLYKNHVGNINHIKALYMPYIPKAAWEFEKIIHFMLYENENKTLRLTHTPATQLQNHKQIKNSLFIFKYKIQIFIILLLVSQILFWLPLGISSIYITNAYRALSQTNITLSNKHLDTASKYITLTKATYAIAQPVYSFLFIRFIPDNLIAILSDSHLFLTLATNTYQNVQQLTPILIDQTTDARAQEAQMRLSLLGKQIKQLKKQASTLASKLTYNTTYSKDIQKKLQMFTHYATLFQNTPEHLINLIGSPEEKRYLLYFYNNMEIRPGGGFLGSFGILSFKKYHLTQFEIYDVYEADGKLTTTIKPPDAIAKYLSQPYWFLRDSAFHPDFEVNDDIARTFLQNEMNISSINGAMGITTTALYYILNAYKSITIPGYNITITKDNFYLQTQLKTEKDFFPGSDIKSSLLTALSKQLLLELPKASPYMLFEGLVTSLNEKQIVMRFDDKTIQKEVENYGWHGRLIIDRCAPTALDCTANYIFPYEANLGANKSNYFVSTKSDVYINVLKNNKIQTELIYEFANNAPHGKFPGGDYNNYFQVLLPSDARIQNVKTNGNVVKKYSVNTLENYTVFQIFLIIKPGNKTRVEITYELLHNLYTSSSKMLQITVQKQIGSKNIPFTMRVDYPDNLIPTELNFNSIAKNNSLVYNTSITTDKIFFIRFK